MAPVLHYGTDSFTLAENIDWHRLADEFETGGWVEVFTETGIVMLFASPAVPVWFDNRGEGAGRG
jgi:hypothetical protein